MSVAEKSDRPSARRLEGLRILSVDDEPDALIFITTILENQGATTMEAHDGNEALEVARREKPDLVTLDLGMPGKNGIEVFQEMREDAELRDIPICIVTGRPEMRKLIYERSDCPPPEGYVDKPFDEKTLLLSLRKIFEVDRKRPRGSS
jgi:CheY-like chemotaxis protein